MLLLKRKLGEKIVIDGDMILEIIEINRTNVKLGFKFPDERSVLRKEILDRAVANGDAGDLHSRGLL